jgi:hypothetical protein
MESLNATELYLQTASLTFFQLGVGEGEGRGVFKF